GRDVVVIGIEVAEEVLLRRLTSRWTCPACQRPYTGPGACETDGKVLEQRADDKPETVRKRLETYRAQTAPPKDFYQERGRYRGVDGLGTVDEVFRRIRQIIDQAQA